MFNARRHYASANRIHTMPRATITIPRAAVVPQQFNATECKECSFKDQQIARLRQQIRDTMEREREREREEKR
jgi:hypothetical protein